MTMIHRSLRDHKPRIIYLHKQNYSEGEIVEQLRDSGVETTFFEVQQHLETWRVIPCPSPVHSKDTDNSSDQRLQDRHDKLGVTCHHGETSHISYISLADLLSDSTPIEKYQQDEQRHEEFAYKLQLPQTQTHIQNQIQAQIELKEGDPNFEDAGDFDDGLMDIPELLRKLRSHRNRTNSPKSRQTRVPRVRRKQGVIKK